MTFHKSIATLVAVGSLLGNVAPAFANEDIPADDSPSVGSQEHPHGRGFGLLRFDLRPQRADHPCKDAETDEERKECIQNLREAHIASGGELRPFHHSDDDESSDNTIDRRIRMALHSFWKNLQRKMHMVFKEEVKTAIETCSEKGSEEEQKECVMDAKAHIKEELKAAIDAME